MNTHSQPLQNRRLFMIGLGIVATLFFAVYAVLEPDRMYLALFFVMIGLFGTWRQYVHWSRERTT